LGLMFRIWGFPAIPEGSASPCSSGSPPPPPRRPPVEREFCVHKLRLLY
jgi:hypothetical protein